MPGAIAPAPARAPHVFFEAMPALSKRAQGDFGGPLASAKNEAMDGDAERAVIGASGQDIAGEGDRRGERQLPRCLRLGNREQMGCEPARPRDRGRLDPPPSRRKCSVRDRLTGATSRACAGLRGVRRRRWSAEPSGPRRGPGRGW